MTSKTRRPIRQLSASLTLLAVALFAGGVISGWISYLHRSPAREHYVPGSSAWWQQLAVAVAGAAVFAVAWWRHRRGVGGRRAGQDSAGQDSAGQASAGQASAGQDSAGQDSADQDSADQDSADQDSADQDSAGRRRADRDGGRLWLLSPLGDAAARRVVRTLSGALRGQAGLGRAPVALVVGAVVSYSLYRAGRQVTGGLDPNFTVNAWGGPSYLGAMACHYLDLLLMIAAAGWLLDRVLLPDPARARAAGGMADSAGAATSGEHRAEPVSRSGPGLTSGR